MRKSKLLHTVRNTILTDKVFGKGYKMQWDRTSLVVEWRRVHLPMQGTWVQFLVQEEPTCHCRVTKHVNHNS